MELLRDKNGLTEDEFLVQYKKKQYEKPSLTADIVVLAKDAAGTWVLLIRRKGHPFLGHWALPGGFANPNEPLEQTARRELLEETGIGHEQMQLVGLFSRPGRDPRGWVVSAAYAASVDRAATRVRAGDDAGAAQWFGVSPEADGLGLPPLAFDHEEILRRALCTR